MILNHYQQNPEKNNFSHAEGNMLAYMEASFVVASRESLGCSC